MIWPASLKSGGESDHESLSAKLTPFARPTTKEVFKKEWKDFQTHARFGLFKASKKLSRKAEF